jgi:hypothetical protein
VPPDDAVCTDGRSCARWLATAKAERVVAGGRTIDVARVKITETGRRALAKRASA